MNMTSFKVNRFNVDVCLKSSFNTWSIIQERSELLFQGFLEEQDLAVARVLHQTLDEIGALIIFKVDKFILRLAETNKVVGHSRFVRAFLSLVLLFWGSKS